MHTLSLSLCESHRNYRTSYLRRRMRLFHYYNPVVMEKEHQQSIASKKIVRNNCQCPIRTIQSI